MAFDELYIANRMLIAVGEETMSSLTDKTKAGRLTRSFYDGFVYEVFHMNINWKFASTRAQLAELRTPAFGYDRQFGVPQGCVRIVRTVDENDRTINYPYKREVLLTRPGNKTIETDVFLTDQETMFVEYVYLRTNPKAWPGWFQKLVILHGALELVSPIKKDDFTALHLQKKYEQAILDAKGSNGAEDMETGKQMRDIHLGNTEIINAVQDAEGIVNLDTSTINRD